MKPTVLIYTDAGMLNGAGSWAVVAFRVDDPENRITSSGRLRADALKSSDLCEAQAMANGLWFVWKEGFIREGDRVAIRCDNFNVVRGFNGVTRRPSKDPNITAALDAGRRIGAKTGKNGACKAIWVKGHRPIAQADAHELMNRECDKLCAIELGRRDRAGKKVKAKRKAEAPAKKPNRYAHVRSIVDRLTGAA